MAEAQDNRRRRTWLGIFIWLAVLTKLGRGIQEGVQGGLGYGDALIHALALDDPRLLFRVVVQVVIPLLVSARLLALARALPRGRERTMHIVLAIIGVLAAAAVAVYVPLFPIR